MLNDSTIDTLWRAARSHNSWLDRSVTDEQLFELYDLLKWAPTAANSSPARFVFVKSAAEKSRLIACMDAGNATKTALAPVTVIIGMDLAFHEKLDVLFPHVDARSWFAGNETLIKTTAFRNSSLQGAYLIMAARAIGLDCGPMSGFDAAKINATFFADSMVSVNFVCSLGYGDPEKLFERNERLAFADACRIV